MKLCRVTKVKVLFLVLVYVCNFYLFEFSAAILEKGLLQMAEHRKMFAKRLVGETTVILFQEHIFHFSQQRTVLLRSYYTLEVETSITP